MKFYPDKTGRFKEFPYYEAVQLDEMFEALVNSYLKDLYGQVTYPLSTDDITRMIEQEAEDLDLYADLFEEGLNVEGITDFLVDGSCRVRIKNGLYGNKKQENRTRTTLAHEYAHVILHTKLPLKEQIGQNQSFQLHRYSGEAKLSCAGSVIHSTPPKTDPMEWQANYGCGALLMPITAVRNLVASYGVRYPIQVGSSVDALCNESLVNQISRQFSVSKDAARVRLVKLNYFKY